MWGTGGGGAGRVLRDRCVAGQVRLTMVRVGVEQQVMPPLAVQAAQAGGAVTLWRPTTSTAAYHADL